MKATCISSLVLAIFISVSATLSADELIVTFVAGISGPESFDGPFEISPFNPEGQFGGGVAVNPDLIQADGQFVVKNFDSSVAGEQTYSFSKTGESDAGVEFFLHSPLLERIEAFTTRIGSNSPNGHSANTKILLPRNASSTTTDENGLTSTGFFGDGSLTVVDGVPTSLKYSIGPDSLSSFDFLFNPSSLEEMSIVGSEFSLAGSYDLNTAGAADAVPYGFNSTLTGNPGSTILDATRGAIQSELDAAFAGGGTGNLLAGKEADGGQPLSFNPLDGTGTLYHYTLSNAELSSVAVVPEPSPAIGALFGLMAIYAICRRR